MSIEDHAPRPDAYSADKTQQGHKDEYPCIVCSAHFPANNLRAKHMSAHHSKVHASWLCRECPRAFAERRDYEAHARQHTGTKGKGRKAECELCKYANKSPDVIRRHMTFDHAKDGSHLPQCDYCEYNNESCCGVSMHMLHSHPDRTERRPKPNGLATPPVTPPKRQLPAATPPPERQSPPTHDAFLASQTAEYDAMSPLEAETLHVTSRQRRRKQQAAASRAGHPARQ
jgi:hypothetical protein